MSEQALNCDRLAHAIARDAATCTLVEYAKLSDAGAEVVFDSIRPIARNRVAQSGQYLSMLANVTGVPMHFRLIGFPAVDDTPNASANEVSA